MFGDKTAEAVASSFSGLQPWLVNHRSEKSLCGRTTFKCITHLKWHFCWHKIQFIHKHVSLQRMPLGNWKR